jgi:hypothetical protein
MVQGLTQPQAGIEDRELMGGQSMGSKGESRSFRGIAARLMAPLTLALLLALGTYAQQPEQQQQDPQSQTQAQQQDPDAQPSQDQSQQGSDSSQTQAPPPSSTSPDKPQGQSQDQAPPPPPAKKPKYAPQDADKPPYASDYPAPRAGDPAHAPSPDQYDPDKDLPPGEQGSQDAPNGTPTANPNGDPNRNPSADPNRGPGANGAPPNRAYNDGGYGAPQSRPYGDDGYGDGGPNNGYKRPQNAPYSRNAAPATPPPATLTIPAGTVLSVRVNEYLSSDRNQVGDRVTATLQQPVVVNGYVVARRGQMVVGQVEAAEKAGRIKGTSQLGIELTDLMTADGQSRPILTELWKGSGGTTHGADAATIGGTTALGAAIGSVADWGRGAAIGAGAGAAAGIGAVLLTRGRPTVIPPETWLTFRLKDPVTVDTTQSARAFLPVSQYDYDNYGGRRGSRYAGGYSQQGPYSSAPYACGYDAPCYPPPAYSYPYGAYPYAGYYGYPAFSFGYYGGHGYYGRGRRW